MADEAVVGQDAAQVLVAFEHDAEQVERLALEPVGGVPDVHDRRQHREVVVGAEHLDAHALVQADRKQMRDGTVAKTVPLAITVRGIVETAEVDQLLEFAAWRIAQRAHGIEVIRSLDHDRHFAKRDGNALGLRAQCKTDGVLQDIGADRKTCHECPAQARAMVLVRRTFCCSWMIP